MWSRNPTSAPDGAGRTPTTRRCPPVRADRVRHRPLAERSAVAVGPAHPDLQPEAPWSAPAAAAAGPAHPDLQPEAPWSAPAAAVGRWVARYQQPGRSNAARPGAQDQPRPPERVGALSDRARRPAPDPRGGR